MIRTLTSPAPALAQDAALLLLRLATGVALIAHGWQKAVTDGPTSTAAGFERLGIPLAELSAWFAIVVEVGGGVLLLLGLLTPLVGLLVAAVMAGAFWFVHRGTEVLVAEGGWEYVAVLGGIALVLAAVGPGRFSVDAALRATARSAT
ncbi:DoxX family protein [Nocardioides sp.]|uniref:DoxX family protein n=1 Tax=Nocardioides sp. TaxID=35761 RepID=UPI0035112330